MPSAVIGFPFRRGCFYRIRELKEFEAALLVARRRDRELDRALRSPRGRASTWIGVRNKALVPLKLFAEHACLSDDDQFVLWPEVNSVVDAQVVAGGRTLSFQFTLAAPTWGEGNGGYQHHQTMVALNENECVVGYPPFTSENGVAVGATCSIATDDRKKACHKGLASAIANKTTYDGRGCSLAVFAQGFYFQLLDVCLFEDLVDAVLNKRRLSFDSICVFDNQPGFFVERRWHPTT